MMFEKKICGEKSIQMITLLCHHLVIMVEYLMSETQQSIII